MAYRFFWHRTNPKIQYILAQSALADPHRGGQPVVLTNEGLELLGNHLVVEVPEFLPDARASARDSQL